VMLCSWFYLRFLMAPAAAGSGLDLVF